MLVAGAFPPLPCGVGDYTARLASALVAQVDVEVAVLTKASSRNVQIEGVTVLSVMQDWSMGALPSLIRALRDWKPDLLHFQYPSQGFYGRRLASLLPLFCRLLGVPSAQTWHEPYRWRSVLPFLAQYVAARGLIFVRPNYFDLLPGFLARLTGKRPWAIIPNAEALPLSMLTEQERLALRARRLGGRQRLIVYFGFVYPHKGVDRLFRIANAATDALVIAGAMPDAAYAQHLGRLAEADGWRGHVTFTGFLQGADAADLLAVADAVVLPFVAGGGTWNTSIHSALAQGTLVITTAADPAGDDADGNLYTADPDDIAGMRDALDHLAGRKVAPDAGERRWTEIARRHADFFRTLL